MNNKMLELLIPFDIGEMTNKKIEALRQKFESEFPNLIRPNNSELIIETNDRSRRIIFTAKQVIINYNNASDNIEDMQGYLKKIVDVFMIDDVIQSMMIRVINEEDFGKNTLEATKNIATDLVIPEWDELSGVGIRYLIKKPEGVYNEFRFEPLLVDSNKFYFEGIFHIFNININVILEAIKENLLKFDKMKEDIIKTKIENR